MLLTRDAIFTYIFDVKDKKQLKLHKDWIKKFISSHKSSALPREVAEHYDKQTIRALNDNIDNLKYESMKKVPLPGNQLFARQKIENNPLLYDDIEAPRIQHELNDEIKPIEPTKLFFKVHEQQTAVANSFIVYDSSYSVPTLYAEQFPIEVSQTLPQNELTVHKYGENMYMVKSQDEKRWWIIKSDVVYTNTKPIPNEKFNNFTVEKDKIKFLNGKTIAFALMPYSVDATAAKVNVFKIGTGTIPDFQLDSNGFPVNDQTMENIIIDSIKKERIIHSKRKRASDGGSSVSHSSAPQQSPTAKKPHT